MRDPAIFTLRRLKHDGRGTIGELLPPAGARLCWTLELRPMADPRVPEPRVARIPPSRVHASGVYPLVLRQSGGWNARLARDFPDIHRGAIEIAEVPGRSAILFHPANFTRELLGCVAPGTAYGDSPAEGLHVTASRPAYRAAAPVLTAAILAPGGAVLRVLDEGEAPPPAPNRHRGTAD